MTNLPRMTTYHCCSHNAPRFFMYQALPVIIRICHFSFHNYGQECLTVITRKAWMQPKFFKNGCVAIFSWHARWHIIHKYKNNFISGNKFCLYFFQRKHIISRSSCKISEFPRKQRHIKPLVLFSDAPRGILSKIEKLCRLLMHNFQSL